LDKAPSDVVVPAHRIRHQHNKAFDFEFDPDDNYAARVQVTRGHGGTPFWEESFPMWILDPMITASFEDLALRGQKPYFSSGEHRLIYSRSPSAGSQMQRVEGE
jgi:hypothetical protein